MRRMDTLSLKQTKEKIMLLLQEAEDKRATSLVDATKILHDVAQFLPQVTAADQNDRRSERNVTQTRETQEILYVSKRGNILYELKEFEKAQECYEFLKKKLPTNTQVYKALGDCLRKQHKFEEALAMYNQGLKMYENDDSCPPSIKGALLNSRGLTHMEQKNHSKAKEDFEGAVKINGKNPLYLCNKGYASYALDDKEGALAAFNQANEMVKSKQLGDLTGQNLEYIEKTLREFVEGLQDLKTVPLKKHDTVMEARELEFVKQNLDALTGSAGSEEKGDEGQEEDDEPEKKDLSAKRAQLKKTKLNVQRIQEDTHLFEYYDGFLYGLAQSYSTAVVIDSGKVLADTSAGKEIDLLASAIKLIPLVGSSVSDGIKGLASFIKGAQVTNAAANICKFATTATMFEEIAQDALVQAIQDNQDEIKAQNDVDLEKIILPRWASRFQAVIDKIIKLKGQLNEMLYGARNETPLQKLGYQTASTLISKSVASGDIYKGEIAVRIKPEEKKKRMTEIMNQLFKESVDKNHVPEKSVSPVSHVSPVSPVKPVSPVEVENRSSCCAMF